MRVGWCAGIVDMSIRSRRGLRISCCRIIWFDGDEGRNGTGSEGEG